LAFFVEGWQQQMISPLTSVGSAGARWCV